MPNERLPCVDPKPSPVELGLCPYCDGEVDYNITDYTANEWCKSPDWKVGIPTWKASISCSNEMCGHTTTFFYSGGGCLIDGIEKRLARFWNTRPNQEDLVEAMEWISVDDRLPECDDYYFVHIPKGKPVVATFYRGSWFVNSNYGLRGVTHWMPLPAPPTQ